MKFAIFVPNSRKMSLILTKLVHELGTHSRAKNTLMLPDVSIHWWIQEGARNMPPGSKFFHFHAVFSKKILKNNSTFGSWHTPSGKSWICHWYWWGRGPQVNKFEQATSDCHQMSLVEARGSLVGWGSNVSCPLRWGQGQG